MKKIWILSLLILFFALPESIGQPRYSDPPTSGIRQAFPSLRDQLVYGNIGWDVGFAMGTSHALTDIGGTADHSRFSLLDTQLDATGLNFGVFGRYRFAEMYAFKMEFNYGELSGADSLTPETSGRHNRGFCFDNQIYELAFKGEVYLPKYMLNVPFDIYGYVGLALFYHDPDLRVPDPDDFEKPSFSHFQPSIPMGFGVHYTFENDFRIGYNIGWRKTFTDHLEGVSTQHSRGNDSFYFNAINISYFLRPRR